MKQIKTERLLLRKITDVDVDDMYEYAKNPLIGEMAGWDYHKSVEETKSIIKTLKLLNTYSIVFEDKMVGTIGYEIFNNKVILGYALSRDYWGKNIMHEALTGLLLYLFRSYDISVIEAHTYLDNIKSQNVLIKLGFTNIKEMTKTIKNKETLVYLFRLTKKEYERGKENGIK